MRRREVRKDMKIHGKYTVDSNFTTVYADGRIYTIARNTGDWGSLGIGERAYIGGILTQERYDELASACSDEGTFVLSEEDAQRFEEEEEEDAQREDVINIPLMGR